MKTTWVQPALTVFFQHDVNDVAANEHKESERDMNEETAKFAENSFRPIMEEGYSTRALDFLRMLPVHRPTGYVFEKLVHSILLRSEIHEVVSRCNFYLLQLLQSYPPFNENQEKFYKTHLFSVHKRSSMWDVLKNPINCTMRQCGISRPSSCPEHCNNCPIYLKYLVNVIKVNYEELETARYACTNANKSLIPLICYLFWPSGKPDCSSKSLHHIVDWIDDLYSIKKSVLQIELLEILFAMLNIAMKCILRNTGCNEVEILGNIHCPALANILQSLNNCKFILTNRTNLEMFFNSIEDQWLRMKICDALLSYMIYNKLHSFDGRISLRRIITKYMLSAAEVKKEVEEGDKENCSDPPRKKMKLSTGRRSTGRDVYELCKTNRPGSLYELLSEDAEAIKARNNLDQTPLHLALLNKSFQCALVLLEGEFTVQADVCAQDKNGDTALHTAAKNGALEVADLLLLHGGSRLASIKNYKGNVALSLAQDNAMKLLLTDYSDAMSVAETKRDTGNDCTSRESVMFENLAALHPVACPPVYLLCIHTLLTDFVNFFKLDEVGDLPNTNDNVQKHLSECHGFSPNVKDIEEFKDDLLVLKNFPKIVENFTKLLKLSSDYDNEVDVFVKWLNYFTITLAV